MVQSRQNASRKNAAGGNKSRKPNTATKQTAAAADSSISNAKTSRCRGGKEKTEKNGFEGDDLSDAAIPLKLQQLMLDVFKTALLTSAYPERSNSLSRQLKNPGIDTHDHGDGDSRNEQQSNPGKESQQEGEEGGGGISTSKAHHLKTDENAPSPSQKLDVKSLIQTIKSHLYNRDFDAAFTDANEELLRAYALRWSAARALGYAGIFKSVFMASMSRGTGGGRREVGRGGDAVDVEQGRFRLRDFTHTNHVVCIGGGAGAEIVALAGAWRDIMDETKEEEKDDLEAEIDNPSPDEPSVKAAMRHSKSSSSTLAITAVDIADWSVVVDRLLSTIKSPAVPGSKSCPAPLVRDEDIATSSDGHRDGKFSVRFRHADVLSLPDDALQEIYNYNTNTSADADVVADDVSVQSPAILVTLMFTLNELFSTSRAKTTAFLLRTTDLLQPGTILLVVDSPGSYSTVRLGASNKPARSDSSSQVRELDAKDPGVTIKPAPSSSSQSPQERQYPMKFLLDHTLLSVAAGKWEKVLSHDSRWWRRDAANLRYDVGEGAGLEDMRYQVHVYRRLDG